MNTRPPAEHAERAPEPSTGGTTYQPRARSAPGPARHQLAGKYLTRFGCTTNAQNEHTPRHSPATSAQIAFKVKTAGNPDRTDRPPNASTATDARQPSDSAHTAIPMPMCERAHDRTAGDRMAVCDSACVARTRAGGGAGRARRKNGGCSKTPRGKQNPPWESSRKGSWEHDPNG
jgi:hypothetical protein